MGFSSWPQKDSDTDAISLIFGGFFQVQDTSVGNFILGLKDNEQKKLSIKNTSKLQAVCYFKWEDLPRKKILLTL